MKLSHGIYALSVAAGLAIGGSALAATATGTTPDQSNDPTRDTTGMAALGVDISNAGTTPDSVKAFVNGLTADQQTGITTGCQSVLANPANASQSVQSFCQALNGQ